MVTVSVPGILTLISPCSEVASKFGMSFTHQIELGETRLQNKVPSPAFSKEPRMCRVSFFSGAVRRDKVVWSEMLSGSFILLGCCAGFWVMIFYCYIRTPRS